KVAEATECLHEPSVREDLRWSLSQLRQGQIAEKSARRVEAYLATRLLAVQLAGEPELPLPEVDESTAIAVAPIVSSGQILRLNADDFTRHGIFAGTTGSGKSTAQVGLGDAFRSRNICLEIFARKEAGRLLLHYPEAIVIRPDQLLVNLLESFGDARIFLAELAPILARGIGIRSDYVPTLLDVLIRTHAGRRAGEPMVSLKQLEDIFRHLGARGSRKCETIANALATFNLFLGDTARVRQGVAWEDKQPVIIYDFEGTPPAYRACLSGLRLLRLQAQAGQQGHNCHLRRVIFHDEAGLEFGREFEAQAGSGFVPIAKRWISQMRSRGIGILFGCQSYGQMTEDIKDNTSIVLAFRSPAPAEAQELAVRLNLTDDQRQHLRQLPDGRAFMIAPGLSRAVEVQFSYIDLGDYPPEESITARMTPVLAQLRQQTLFSREEPIKPLDIEKILAAESPDSEATPTESSTQPASNPGLFSGMLLGDQLCLLRDVVDYSESGVAERFRRLGFGGAKGNRIKQELIDLGLLTVVEVRRSIAGAPTKILRLTDAARNLPGL
ncbi:MAG: hypothetical protein NTZ16_14295, partial [Verrucomicrobia bacterium]|nr:hypothetical protein [Verrucomicrobiota bacterium]